MPTECRTESFYFGVVEGRAVESGFDGGLVTSDAGALLLKKTDRAIGLIDRLAACFHDGRRADLIEHEVATLVGQRVFAIALGYEDLNDHDELRHDPMMAVLAGKLTSKREKCAPVAGKSTLNRLELSRLQPTRYHMISHNPVAIRNLLVDVFLEAHARAPKQIILDLDATDDPLHGMQEGRFFNAYYDCYCYLPLYVFCGPHLLVSKLRGADVDAAAGAVEEVARLVRRIRAAWPATRILLRADSGFAREELMAWCEANGVDFLLGLAKNERLLAAIAIELDRVAANSSGADLLVRHFGIDALDVRLLAAASDEEARQRLRDSLARIVEAVGNNSTVIEELAAKAQQHRRDVERMQKLGFAVQESVKAAMQERGLMAPLPTPTKPR